MTPIATFRKFTNGRPAWWERDNHLDLDAFGPPVERGHENCRHRDYRLTCGEYEQLLRRAGGHCEICGLPDFKNPKGKLHIDHDGKVGDWAVRGLLCHDCNATVRFPWMATKAATYEASAWYRLRLAELGIPLATPPEPPIGASVIDHRGLRWDYREPGWVLRWGTYPPSPKAWGTLAYLYGPHNLRDAGAPRPLREVDTQHGLWEVA